MGGLHRHSTRSRGAGRYRYRNHQRSLRPGETSLLLQLVLRGSSWFTVDGQDRQELKAGQAFLCTMPQPRPMASTWGQLLLAMVQMVGSLGRLGGAGDRASWPPS